MALRDAQVGEEQRDGLRHHRRAAVCVNRELVSLHPFLPAAVRKQALRERCKLTMGDHPPNDVSAVHVDDDVEVEVAPLARSKQLGYRPDYRVQLRTAALEAAAAGELPLHKAQRVTPYDFRHSRATYWGDMGASITEIAYMMGTSTRLRRPSTPMETQRAAEALLVRMKEADSMPLPRGIDALVTALWQKLHGKAPPEQSTIELLERLVGHPLDDAAAEADDDRSSTRELDGIVGEPGDG